MNLVEIIGQMTIENLRLRSMCQSLTDENGALNEKLAALPKPEEKKDAERTA